MEYTEIDVSKWLKTVSAGTLFVFAGLLLTLWSNRLEASDEKALALRGNVVRITADWQNGQTHNGFGFITGEQGGALYIATANHVVRGGLPDELAEVVKVTFFSLQGEEYQATLLGTSNSLRDLAVLRVSDTPRGLVWDKQSQGAAKPKRSMPVWYVGKSANWFVPTTEGAINSIGLDDRIVIDGFDIVVGTSGAPLIAESGIVGMILSEENGIAYALPIDFIQKAFSVWNHPWQLVAGREPATVGAHNANSTKDGWTIIGKYTKRGQFEDLVLDVPGDSPAIGHKYKALKRFRLVQKGPTERSHGEAVITMGMVNPGDVVEVRDIYIKAGRETRSVYAKLRAVLESRFR